MCGGGVCGNGLFDQVSTMKNMKVLFVLAVFLWGQVVTQYTDYCALCSNHTRCIYRGLGSKCGYTSVGGSLSESEKQVILDTHNSLRALVALGGETRGYPGPQPAATDMQYLTWDDELARTAQAWADQCDFGHDACRLDPRFSVGQNVFLSEGGVPWEQALLSWYSEVEFMDAANVDNFIFDEVTGHYAQMVWGNTRRIGCGKRTYPQRPKRYYKRDTSHAGEYTPQLDEHFQEAQEENIRQARRIGNYQSNSRNQFGQEKGYQNNDKYQQNYYTQQPTTANNQQYYYSEEPQTPKPVQQTSDIHKKQLKFYKNYLDQMKQLDSPYLSYENKYRLYKELEQKHEILSNIHSRVLYHDQRLKDKIARTKKLNPYIQKGYSFQPDHTVVSGKEFEYYVCNYGPTGLYPGARMYTKGYNNCPYGGLCADPLTVSFYSGLDRENDPILSLLNDSK